MRTKSNETNVSICHLTLGTNQSNNSSSQELLAPTCYRFCYWQWASCARHITVPQICYVMVTEHPRFTAHCWQKQMIDPPAIPKPSIDDITLHDPKPSSLSRVSLNIDPFTGWHYLRWCSGRFRRCLPDNWTDFRVQVIDNQETMG